MKAEKFYEGINTKVALDKALEDLNLTEFDIEYEIIQTAKSGFLGLGKTLAKIKVTYDDGVEEPKVRTVKEEIKISKEPMPKPNKAPEKESLKAPEVKEEKTEKTNVNLDEANLIKKFIEDLLKEMKINANVEMFIKEDGIRFNLVSENSGIIIGKHGETLNAIQYLTKIYTNKISKDRVRISVDTANYRKKRTGNLESMAIKAYSSVMKTGRDYAMPPLSAYERRIVHEYLQNKEGIKTFSVGEEPNRRLTISKI